MKWKELSRAQVLKTFLFNVMKVGFQSESSGKQGFFDVLETKDWANVVAITPRDEVVMVRQFRFGIGAVTLEFPAGAIEVGEAPIDAARRELLEETGHAGSEVRAIGKCHPNPAFLNNVCHHFLARGVEVDRDPSLDEFEELQLVLVPLDQIDAMIADGRITHSLSIAAWYFFKSDLDTSLC